MDMQEGDEIHLPTLQGYIVKAVADSVYLKNGLKHIRLHLLQYSGWINEFPFTFIESVGPTYWVVYPYWNDWNTMFALNCFQNQTIFYKNDQKDTDDITDLKDCPCGYASPHSAIHFISENDYSVIIQKGKIDLSFSSDISADLSIYDIHGRLCYTKDNVFARNITVSTELFDKGVYLLKIFDRKNNRVQYDKILLK
jgi:hypothetical protein